MWEWLADPNDNVPASRELQSVRNAPNRVVGSDYPKPHPSRRSARSCVVKPSVLLACNDMPTQSATDETETSSEYNPGKSTEPSQVLF